VSNRNSWYSADVDLPLMKHAHHRFDPETFRVGPGKPFHIADRGTSAGEALGGKKEAAEALAADVSQLRDAQQRLYADGTRAILVVLQGMDAAGKDGLIRHVMGGINPQGCRVESFKAPNAEELRHHFLWRPMRFLPQRGMITIFNRSYYEEVLVVRVHPRLLEPQKLVPYGTLDDLWRQRFSEIVEFESMLVRHGTSVLKFFLHVSREEQRKRLLERLTDPAKRWKFDERDLAERDCWKEYETAIDAMLPATSSPHAPWHVIPADDKWYARAAVADLIAGHVDALDLDFPEVPASKLAHYEKLAKQLERG
jgi:PPK2 family polyphosphate:nucleotide phosphotransferase